MDLPCLSSGKAERKNMEETSAISLLLLLSHAPYRDYASMSPKSVVISTIAISLSFIEEVSLNMSSGWDIDAQYLASHKSTTMGGGGNGYIFPQREGGFAS